MIRVWQRRSLVALLLVPLALVFRTVVAVRRLLFRRGWLHSERVAVPVIVVGNITVGGTGKSPLTIHLAQALRARGRHPGIVSRGHGGRVTGTMAVTAASDPREVGDEPVLLATRSGAPVRVGRDRVAAARALLADHPECDVLLCDDGLQHYRLQRDFEIAVVDARRGFGNGLLLPAGPLREPRSRLRQVDAIVLNGGIGADRPEIAAPCLAMRLVPRNAYRVGHPARQQAPEDLRGRHWHAVAGIGDPERFFATLESLGLDIDRHPFPDHHAYTPEDFAFGPGPVMMTEKDAVKCAGFGHPELWALAVDAEVDPALVNSICARLETLDRNRS